MQNIQTLRWCRLYGITVAWNFLHGFPDENPSEYDEMAGIVPLLHHLDAPVFFGRVRMDRHSPYFSSAKDFELSEIRPYQSYAMIYRLPETEIFDLAYYFEFEHVQSRSVEYYTAETAKQVREWQGTFADGVILRATPTGDGRGVVTDGRRIAIEREFTIVPEAWAILEYCDEIRHVDSIPRALDRWPAGRVDAALRELERRALIIREGSLLLSLPVVDHEAIFQSDLTDQFRLGQRILTQISLEQT